jgi:hypothetical protein
MSVRKVHTYYPYLLSDCRALLRKDVGAHFCSIVGAQFCSITCLHYSTLQAVPSDLPSSTVASFMCAGYSIARSLTEAPDFAAKIAAELEASAAPSGTGRSMKDAACAGRLSVHVGCSFSLFSCLAVLLYTNIKLGYSTIYVRKYTGNAHPFEEVSTHRTGQSIAIRRLLGRLCLNDQPKSVRTSGEAAGHDKICCVLSSMNEIQRPHIYQGGSF